MGYFLLIASYLIWGSFPIAFYQVRNNDPLEVFFYRILFCFILITVFAFVTGKAKAVVKSFNAKNLSVAILTGIFLGLNWFCFIAAILLQQTIQMSLGYLISPILGIVLAHFFLRERLNVFQSFILAILTMTLFVYATLTRAIPTIALLVALSWGFYGFIQRKYPLDPVFKMTAETGLVLIVLIPFIPFFASAGHHIGTNLPKMEWLSLFNIGFLSIVSLLCYNQAVKSVPFQITSILQYCTPLGQIVCGYFFYREPMPLVNFICYLVILGLALAFSISNIIKRARQKELEKIIVVKVKKP